MISPRLLANGVTSCALLLTCACGQQSPGGNAGAAVDGAANANVPAPTDCAPPEILLAQSGTRLTQDIVARTKANFASAYGQSCVKGILGSGELLDPKAVDPGRLFLFNAPEANVASIYLSKRNGDRMVLEFPFLTADGRATVPSVNELEEAIYCNLVGTTPEEQEKDGRCLPD